MAMKSFLNKLAGKDIHEEVVLCDGGTGSENLDLAGEVDHLWMKEDLDEKKPKLEKNPKIDTGILRNRIADKIAKMNNH